MDDKLYINKTIEIKSPKLHLEADSAAIKEEKYWEKENKKEDLKDKATNRKLKILFALATLALVSYWIHKVLGIVVLEGYHINGFHLSDSVLITLLSTTSLNIFGYLYIVLKYLFNNNNSKK